MHKRPLDFDIAIIGGGASGFFAACECIAINSSLRIAIFERSKEVLSKVRISGGGRCNVTNGCLDPKELVQNYPRGGRELLGPFNRFCTGDTVDWFENKGVELKTEKDNRVFPVSNNSKTIVDCLINHSQSKGIEVYTQCAIKGIQQIEDQWLIKSETQEYVCEKLLIAGGSSPQLWKMLAQLGHSIVTPLPSLFTFNCIDPRIKNLPGLSVEKVDISINEYKLYEQGPLLITHWGLSGPAVLKLSAWGARILSQANYQFNVTIDFTAGEDENLIEKLKNARRTHPLQKLGSYALVPMPRRLWQSLCGNLVDRQINSLNDKDIQRLAKTFSACNFEILGKSTFKDEFVTAGGVQLNEVDFKTMQSRKLPGLYFSGEVLDVDAITGGFNFQAAWTTAWIAAQSMTETIHK